MAADQLVAMAWHQLSESIPVTLHEFRDTRAIRLRENLWRLEKHGSSLNLQLLPDEAEILATRRMSNGDVLERRYRIASTREDLPLLMDRAGNLASPILVLNALLTWFVQGS